MIRSKIKLDIVNTVNNEEEKTYQFTHTMKMRKERQKKWTVWVEKKIEIKFNYKFIKERRERDIFNSSPASQCIHTINRV